MSQVQVGPTNLTWRTALRCNTGGCVMVAADGRSVYIGDTKKPDGPILSYTAAEWREFLSGAKNGDFDDLI